MSDKIKKLSDAIRLGATFRPQCTERYFKGKGSCALGAAAEAVGISSPIGGKLYARFPELHCVELNGRALWSKITQLNDSGSTREQIADWLASIGY